MTRENQHRNATPGPRPPRVPKGPRRGRRHTPPVGPRGPQKGPENKGPKLFSRIISVILVLLVVASVYSLIAEYQKDIPEISLSEVAAEVNDENVEEIVVRGEKVEVFLVDGTEKESKKEAGTALTDTLVNYGVSPESLKSLSLTVKNPTGIGYWLGTLAPLLIPLFIILFFVWYLMRSARGGAGMQAFTFGQSRARMIDPSDTSQKVTFKNVAGAKEAKEELTEIVDFLKNPKKFLDIGAEIPKGVVLMGAPGTGKTLLARAVAGEANVPFFTISGSEFVEMFVGVGASRVRDLFKMAKKSAPAIVFVDEIDAVGRTRGSGVGGGNDEREQTLNQILVEMDGFEPNEKVIVMAATNRPDVLDPALLRPGRFDRRIVVDLPDLDDREQILKVHIKKKPLADNVNLRTVAERTPGFSGAELSSLVNEAALLAARKDRKKVEQEDFIQAIEKVMLGPERQSHLLSDEEKKITAYHEAGHALVASVLPHTDPVHKITIISRGRALGYVMNLPIEEKKLKGHKQFLDDLAVMLGGYAVEQNIFKDITTGPSNDLENATRLARSMVTRFGMSEAVGPVALETFAGQPLQGKILGEREHSEKVQSDVDAEVKRLVEEALQRATDTITEHRSLLNAIAEKLLEVETIERDSFEKLLLEHGVTPKKQKEGKPGKGRVIAD